MFGHERQKTALVPSILSPNADLEEEMLSETQSPGQARSLNFGQSLSLVLVNPAPEGRVSVGPFCPGGQPAWTWSSRSFCPQADLLTGTSLMHHSVKKRRHS